MIVNRKDLTKYLTFFSVAILGYMFIYFTDNVFIHISIVVLHLIICIFFSKLNFSHPLFWFSVFFFLYSCAYNIIIIMYPNDALAKGYDSKSSLLILLSLNVVSLFTILKERLYTFNKFNKGGCYHMDLRAVSLLFVAFCASLLICVLILRLQGVTSKQEQWTQHNLFWVFAAYSTRFLAFLSALLLFIDKKKKRIKRKLIFCVMLTAFYSMSTGERDGLLRLIVILLLALSMLNRLKKSHLVIIGIGGVLLMILMNYLKYFFVTGTLNTDFLSKGNILYAFLYTDFADCGSNMQMLLNHPELKGTKGIDIIFTDFISAFLPSGIINVIYGDITNWNISEWYNNYFYRGSSWNRSFTIIGEGYVAGGIVGVIVVFTIIGLIIRILYKKSTSSPYYATSYVYAVATIISSFRGDMATIFQGIIRIPIAVIVLLWILKKKA